MVRHSTTKAAGDKVLSGDWNAEHLLTSGLDASRPGSGLTAGQLYWATDTKILYRATGPTTWEEILRGESVSRLAQLSDRAHGSLTGVTASQHHAKTVSSDIDHGSVQGLGDDDHTQYVLRNILTTQGDLFVRGVSTIESLAAGASGKVLKSQGAGQKPVWGDAPGVTLTESQVYNGVKVNAWADLDLSSVVGAKAVAVLLRVENNASSQCRFNVRENGDTHDYDTVAAGVCATSGQYGELYAGEAGLIMCKTDANGIIEWKTNRTGGTVTIDVVAYWES